ncbi:MAG: hypothetical protein GW900_00760 [Gammaproteobacteria bacterium]|nr:hypothetical protein [Gammaproteobacteria bacterium]
MSRKLQALLVTAALISIIALNAWLQRWLEPGPEPGATGPAEINYALDDFEARFSELGIEHLLQGREDKGEAFAELLRRFDIQAAQAAYMGDDLVDWAAMRHAGLKLCPADADAWLREQVDCVMRASGGRGAVREAAELLLAGHDRLQAWRESFR